MADIDRALQDIAAGRAADRLAPVTVVAPSHVAAIQLRRRLAERTPYAGVRFETLPRLAELLGAPALAAAGKAPLARPIGDYVAGEVARAASGGLTRLSGLPGFPRVLRQAFRRLRRAGIRSPADVPAAAARGHLPAVLDLYGRFRDLTASFYDDEDLLEAAAAALRAGRAAALADLGSVLVAPPGAQTAGAAALLDALASAAPAFQVLDEAEAMAEARCVLAPDPASEVREAVREVIAALSEGLGRHQVAVFHGADRSYQRLLREAFAAAAIPAAVMPGTPLIETPAGRSVLSLARLPEEDFSRTALMDFLALAPLRHEVPGRAGPLRVYASAWDRISREAGITHGHARWRDSLSGLIAEWDHDIAALEERDEGRGRFLQSERERARALLSFLEALVERLVALQALQPAGSFIAAFGDVVSAYIRRDAPGMEAVRHEVEQLGTVGAVGGSFRLESFTRALEANLRLAATRETGLGEGVLVADYRLAAGLSFERVVLCGAFEGALPASPGFDSVVDDAAWAALRQHFPWVEDAALRTERSRQAASRAAASARSALIWTAPLYEAGATRDYYPSPPMVAAAAARDAAFKTASGLRRAGASAWLRRGVSPLAAMLVGPAVDRLEASLRESVRERQAGIAFGPGHRLSRPVTLLRSRRAPRFTEFDGNLAGLADWRARLLERGVSPTALEDFATCGFRYLCKSVLRLNVIDEPEARDVMDSAARGSLVHEVLEAFFREQQARGRPAVGEDWGPADVRRIVALADERLQHFKRRGIGGLDVYAEHEARSLRADLVAFLEADNSFRRETGAVPAEFEVRIPETRVGDVTLRGYADRIDRSPDGRRAWVIDYKTGSKSPYEKLPDSPLLGGTKLQLPAYLAAVRDAQEVQALYWFVSRKGAFERIRYEPGPAGGQRFQATLAAIVDALGSGAFPAVSGDEDDYRRSWENCVYCDFTRICSRRRHFELADKGDDPALAPWFAIARTAEGDP